jgi:hypothetical protein
MVQELKTLTRDQDALVQMQTRLVNQLTACLKEYYPAALHLFSKLQQHSTLVFLQAYPTPQAAQVASEEEILATLRIGKHTKPRQAATEIVEELHRPQLVASPVMVRTRVAPDALPGQTIAGRHRGDCQLREGDSDPFFDASGP